MVVQYCDNCLLKVTSARRIVRSIQIDDDPNDSLPVGLAIMKIFQTLDLNYYASPSSTSLLLDKDKKKGLKLCGGCGELLSLLLNSTLTLFKLMKEESTLAKLLKGIQRTRGVGGDGTGGVESKIKEEEEESMEEVTYDDDQDSMEMESSSSSLGIIKMKNEEDPAICPTCGKQFITEKALDVHMVTHDEKRSKELLYCGLCDKMFSTPHNLKQHNKSVHQGIKVGKRKRDGAEEKKRNFVHKLLRGENVYS